MYVTDVIDDDSTDEVRVLMEYGEELHRHPREDDDIRGAMEALFGELCANHVFRPVTIEFQASNVTYEFTLSGEWMERYEKQRAGPVHLQDMMTRIYDSYEVVTSNNS